MNRNVYRSARPSITRDVRQAPGVCLEEGNQQNVMSTTRRIGILTGGGDVPGLNAAIKSVTYRATELGWEVVGVRRGWKGLTHLQPGVAESEAEYLVPLDRLVTRTIDRTGGTWLHSSRTNPRKMKRSALPAHVSDAQAEQMRVGEDRYDMTPVVLRNMEALGLDYLIPIGGDDTLSYSQILHDAGANLIAIPKTMDNDVQGTEYCIGFSTAITRARDAINRQRSTIGSHERIGVFRIFGRDAGFTALYSAFVTSGRCLIPEAPYDVEALAAVLASDHATNPSHYAFVITAEGAIWEGGSIAEVGEADAFGHRHKANVAEDPGGGDQEPHGYRHRPFRPHLRPALRRAGLGGPDGGHGLRQHGRGARGGGSARAHDGHPRGPLLARAAAGSGAGRCLGGRRPHVRPGSFPAALRRPPGPPAHAGPRRGPADGIGSPGRTR